MCAYQVHDKGFTVEYAAAIISGSGLDRQRTHSELVVGTLLARAQAAGSFRAELGPADFTLLLSGNAGVITAAGADAATASRRYVTHMLRSFQA